MKGVGRLLDDPVAEERVHRLWQGTRGRMRRAERRRVAVKVGAAVSALALAVIGPRVAQNVSDGWKSVRAASAPDDAALLSLAADMCN